MDETTVQQLVGPEQAAPPQGQTLEESGSALAGSVGEDREGTAHAQAMAADPGESGQARAADPLAGEDTPANGGPGEEGTDPDAEDPEKAQNAQDQDPQEPLALLALQLLEQQARQQLARQLEQIHRLDPELGDLAALARQPEFPEFDRLVKSGQDLVSAYKLAFFERYARNSAQAARQAAINAARSKEHLAAVGQGSHPQDDGLTDELIQRYRIFNPGMSRSQIARYHARYRKEKQDVSYF